MGLGLSRRREVQPPILNAAELQHEFDSWPPPKYEERLWMASCRPLSDPTSFTPGVAVFQPDCRLFCRKGPACELRAVQPHGELYIHAPRQALLAAAKRDLDSQAAAALAHPTGKGDHGCVALPFVRHCCLADRLQATEPGAPTHLAGRSVVVWVHGFSQHYFRVMGVSTHLLRRLGATCLAPPPAPAVLAFLWPSRIGKATYALARGNAGEAALRLQALLHGLRRLGCRTVIVGHSLGCRVALSALLRPAAAQAEADRSLCAHLLLLGAAVPGDALSERGDFPRSRLVAAEVSVLYSGHDEVLRRFFPLGEASSGRLSGLMGYGPPALGLRGPTEPVPEGCHVEDVSDSVRGHNPNQWLLSPAVVARISGALGVPTGPVEEDAASGSSNCGDGLSASSGEFEDGEG